MFGNSRFLSSILFIASSAVLSTTASPVFAREVNQSATPIPPSQDPFYTAPTGFEAATPGTILRFREAPGNLTSTFNLSSSVYNILYRTTNSLYQPAWAVSTLFVPESATKNSTNDALLSYQIPYNTADVDYSPSYVLHGDLTDLGLIFTDIQTALGYGWHVSVPDFEGPLASFGAGVLEGHSVLDSTRAALSPHLGLSTPTRYALWGYSGGSLASEWAAELQVQYAPELNFSGMAIGGLIPNLTRGLLTIDGTPASGLIPAALLGITNQWPSAYNYIISQLNPIGLYNSTTFLTALNLSYYGDALLFASQTILADYFINGSGASVIQSPLIQHIANTNGVMGYHGVPQMPVFVYKAVHDEYSHINETDALVEKYCGVGANITYQRNTVGNHLDEETNGDASALQWLKSVLDVPFDLGYESSTGGCTTVDVAINISDHGAFES